MAAQYPFSDHPGPPVEPKTSAGEFSRPLSDGESRALAMQSANRASPDRTWEDWDRINQRAIETDMAVKSPRFFGPR
jgi:hypothetical protein